jgi:fatty-acyl-CoA synthase
MLRHAALVRPRHPAVIDSQRQLTYHDLQERVIRLANGFRAGLALSPGTRVVLLSENRAEVVELYFAAALAGVVIVPIDSRLAAAEVREIVVDADARVAIVSSRAEEAVGDLRDAVETQIAFGDAYEAFLRQGSSREPGGLSSADAVFLQMYTSGSTGTPKGVLLSQGNLSANSWHLLAERSLIPADRYLNTAPLAHLAAGSRVFVSVLAAATHVIHDGFDVERVSRAISSGTVTATVVVPTMLQSLLSSDALDDRGSTQLRQITYGAAPIPIETLHEALTRFACDFQQGYGLTEAGNNLTILPPDDHRPSSSGEFSPRLSSIGRETIGVHVRVVDENDQDVTPGAVGEVIARGPNIMQGYWRRPAETAEALKGGWLRTGDLATVDDDAYIYLVSRKSDMLISGGLNVYPAEIEKHLITHPGVRHVVVIGAPNQRWGEVPVAFIDAVPGAERDALVSELRSLCATALARYKHPADYVFVTEIPRTGTGKVARAALRDQFRKARAAGS